MNVGIAMSSLIERPVLRQPKQLPHRVVVVVIGVGEQLINGVPHGQGAA